MGRVASPPRLPQLVIGVDPGYAACGIVTIQAAQGRRWRLVNCATIETPPEQPLNARIATVWAAVRARLASAAAWPPGHARLAYEAQDRVQESKRSRGQTSHRAAALHQVVGAVQAAAWERELEAVEVQPSELRRALGLPRNASKQQVQRALRAVLLDCPEKMQLHESDAGAAAFCARSRPAAMGR